MQQLPVKELSRIIEELTFITLSYIALFIIALFGLRSMILVFGFVGEQIRLLQSKYSQFDIYRSVTAKNRPFKNLRLDEN